MEKNSLVLIYELAYIQFVECGYRMTKHVDGHIVTGGYSEFRYTI